jgi:hypothetical protein
MLGIMADKDVEGQFEKLVRLFSSPLWKEIWLELQITDTSFEKIGLPRTAPDAVVWQVCQSQQIILITGNRNDDGPESLEATIQRYNKLDSLRVITLARPRQILESKEYLHRTAEKMLERLMDLDHYRGAGRIYVP